MIEDAGREAAAAYRAFFVEAVHNPHTRRAYERAALDVLAWCDGNAGLETLDEVGHAHVEAWWNRQRAMLAPATARLRLAALRALFRFLADKGVIADPTQNLRLFGPAPPLRPAAIVGAKLVDQLIDTIDPVRPDGARDRALIALLADHTMRVGVAIRLRVGNAVVVGDEVRLSLPPPARGDAPREVEVIVLTSRAAAELATLLLVIGPDADPATALFPSMPRGTRRLGSAHMAQADVFRMIQRRARSGGFGEQISPRALASGRPEIAPETVALRGIDVRAGRGRRFHQPKV